MRNGIIFLAGFLIAALIGLGLWAFLRSRNSPESATSNGDQIAQLSDASHNKKSGALAMSTKIHAHNLLLRKGPDFRVYIRWLNGELQRTRKNKIPSFDDPESFLLYIQTGVLRANIGDIGNFLSNNLAGSPLTKIHLTAEGDQLKLTGTVHKGVPLPIEALASVSSTPDNRVRVHVNKLNVLKIPVKGLLGMFKVSVADLLKAKIDGLEVMGNDLLFDTQKLLPAPHIHGQLSRVRVVSPDLEEVFGNASTDVERVELWRNFLSLKGGALDFGKLTMNDVDLMMIDISKDPWFDLDLVNYQAQLTNGYTRMTAQSGLQIFMPDLREVKVVKGTDDSNIEWFKNRNIPPPSQISSHAGGGSGH